MDEITPEYQGRIKRLRNLKMYADSTDEEILEAILRKDKEKETKAPPEKIDPKSYDYRYKKLFDRVKAEYSVDMNDSNDLEALKNLVRQTLQLETIDGQIRELQATPANDYQDSRTLKNLSDVQRSLIMSVTDLQDRLGISRKARKEKAVDDIPMFIAELKKRGTEFWQRKTVQVRCEKCTIELARYWLNFPDLAQTVRMELECWRCHEKVIHVR